jgi:type I restriction enzyme S subunit
MSRLTELIEELCPDGVEYRTLSEVATDIYRGSGITRDQVTSTGIPCVRYGEIYTTYNIWFDKCVSYTDETVIKSKKYFEYGDILFAITGESVEDIAKSCVYIGNERCLAGGDIVVLKHNQEPKYMSYVLSTIDVKRQKSKGKVKSKVVHSSVPAIKEIIIPIPPRSIQREIIRILDKFIELTENLIAELTVELIARRKQYEYYCGCLLRFEDTPYYDLEELCDIVDYRGKTPKKVSKGTFLITAKNIRKGYIDYDKSQEFIAEEDYKIVMRRGLPKIGDVLITTEAPCGNVAQIDKEDIALAQRIIKYRPKNNSLDATFLKYILLGEEFQNKLLSASTGGTVKGIKGSKLHKLTIPLPTIEEQQYIVDILNRFDALCNDISAGLAAEIKARQKQYEYYRDKLLTFKMRS